MTTMQRPLPVTVIAFMFLAAGAIGFVFHLADFATAQPFQYDTVGIALVRLIAVICGVFLLRGRNWARWLALGWLLFHVGVSMFHSPFELVVHSLLCAVCVYFLFRPGVAEYFRAGKV